MIRQIQYTNTYFTLFNFKLLIGTLWFKSKLAILNVVLAPLSAVTFLDLSDLGGIITLGLGSLDADFSPLEDLDFNWASFVGVFTLYVSLKGILEGVALEAPLVTRYFSCGDKISGWPGDI